MSSGAYSSLVMSFGICGGGYLFNNENFPDGKFGKRKKGAPSGAHLDCNILQKGDVSRWVFICGVDSIC